MRKLSTFIVTVAVAIATIAPCKVHATTFNPPTDSVVMKAFPNPTASWIKIEKLDPNLDLRDAEIIINTAHGEQIFTRRFGNGEVDLSAIRSRHRTASGIYYVNVIDKRGKKISTIAISKPQ